MTYPNPPSEPTSQLNSPTTIGSIIGAVGTLATGVGFFGMFFPPLIALGPIGAAISAFAKYYTGLHTSDVK